MDLPYQLIIALRYLKSRKRHRSVSVTTLITIGGVAVGVMALLVVLSVMSGFHADLQKKILGVNTHVIVLGNMGFIGEHEELAALISAQEHVVSVSPFVLGQVMVSFGGNAQGVYLRGIEPALEVKTTEIEAHMKSGSLLDLGPGDEEVPPGIALGTELATRLGVMPGDVIRVLSPTGGTGPLGVVPKQKKFLVTGIFEIGMFEYDANLTLTALGPAQGFFGFGRDVTGLELRVDDIYRAPEIGRKVVAALGPGYYSRDWIRMNRNLFAALKLEKLAMFVILALIVLVAAFNIVSTQIMNVIEKEREIAILKAMGATRSGIMSIFMIQGFLIGLIGTAIGLIGGTLTGYLMDRYEIIKLPADVYYLSHLPAQMNPLDFAVVTISAVLISFAATLYPAWQASKLDPVEPLRYE